MGVMLSPYGQPRRGITAAETDMHTDSSAIAPATEGSFNESGSM